MDDIKKEQTVSPLPQQIPHQLQYLFLDAFKFLLEGRRITKLQWANSNIYGIIKYDDNYKTKILMLHKEDDKFYQWILAEEDILGDDWVVVREGN